MEKSSADEVMEESNRILQDFPIKKYAIYLAIFGIEVAVCFWLGLTL